RQVEYDAYRQSHPSLPPDVFDAPDPAIADIYLISYWQPWCPQFEDGVDYVFFDVAVLSGPGKAARWLQQTLGVTVDGHIGVATLTALGAAKRKAVISGISDTRRADYNAIVAQDPVMKKFLKGWLARVDRVRDAALAM